MGILAILSLIFVFIMKALVGVIIEGFKLLGCILVILCKGMFWLGKVIVTALVPLACSAVLAIVAGTILLVTSMVAGLKTLYQRARS